MWSKIRTLSLIFSLSLNIAFIGVWLGNTFSGINRRHYSQEAKTSNLIWCPLHQNLGISEEQWRQIEPLLISFQTRAEEQRQKIVDLRMQMIDLIKSSPISRTAIRAKQDEIGSAQDIMKSVVIEHLLEEKEILTQEQQRKFFEMIHNECRQAWSPPLISSQDKCVGKEE